MLCSSINIGVLEGGGAGGAEIPGIFMPHEMTGIEWEQESTSMHQWWLSIFLWLVLDQVNDHSLLDLVYLEVDAGTHLNDSNA